MHKRLEIRGLGGLTVQMDGALIAFETQKEVALLVYLACTKRTHLREVVAEMLWEERTQSQALANLRHVLAQLRQRVGPFVTISRQSLTMNAASDWWLDVTDFERQLDVANAQDLAMLESALTLYQGDFLEGIYVESTSFEEWSLRERERLRLRAIDALDQLITQYAETGDYTTGITRANQLLAMDNLREKTHRQLMDLLWRSGERGAALAQYDTCRQVLGDELGLEPADDTNALYEQIKAGQSPAPLRPTGIRGYAIQALIGQGSFGEVYRAFQPIGQSRREVAIKVIRPEYANQPDFIRRFEIEAQVIAQLEHQNIVPLYDYWRELDGAYLVMRLLRENLHHRLQRTPLTVSECVRLVEQISAALTTAHTNGVIHRDLKPANILLDDDGNAYLTDFGIAKVLGSALQATQQRALIGSPGYLSPEQIKHEPVTSKSDIYSFGILLYEALTGTSPFPGHISPAALLQKHLTKPLPSLLATCPDLPPALDTVIQQATAKNPGERFQSALDLAAAFRQAAGEAGLRVSPTHTMAITDRFSADTRTWTPADSLIVHRNPYKGLNAFLEADAGDFFGRTALVNRLLGRLTEDHPLARFLAIVGPSGSGKSSVARAGVLEGLHQGALPESQDWYTTIMLPGAHPLDELEVALSRVMVNPIADLMEQLQRDARGLVRATQMILPEGSELVVLIDQFEELFLLTEDVGHTRHMLDLLVTATSDPRSQVRVIGTLRADFYDRPLLYADFGDLLRQRTEVVLPLTGEELERAIVGPAESVGVQIEPALTSAIIAEVTDQPGALPMLQYTLTELFERRTHHTMTLQAYRDLGGVMGILSQQADAVYHHLETDSQRDVTRQLFLRLLTLGEGTEDTRRRTLQTELVSVGGEAMQKVIALFGHARLLTFDHDPVTRDPTVEVAHEALLREWGQIRAWLDENRHAIRQQRMLATASQEWIAHDRDVSYLLYGSRLAQFEEWATTTNILLTEDERAHLDASIIERERQAEMERVRRQHEIDTQRHAANRLRYLVGGLIIFLVAALGLSLFAFDKQREAKDARRTSEANATYARNLALVNGAQAALAQGDDLDTALMLAVAANQTGRSSAEAQMILSQAAYTPGTIRQFTIHNQGIIELSLAPDGRTALSAAWQDGVTLWDIETGTVIHRLSDFRDGWNIALFSPDGEIVLAVTGNTSNTNWGEVTLSLFDVKTGNLIRQLDNDRILPNGFILVGGFSPDGRWILASNGGGFDDPAEKAELIIWDANTGQVDRTLLGYDYGINSAAFSPDGQTILSVMSNHVLTLAKAQTGEIIQQFGESQDPSMTGWHQDILFAPDGHTAITARSDGLMVLWDMEAYQEIRRFEIGSNIYKGNADLSSDGRTVAVASTDAGVTLWDVQTGQLLGKWVGDLTTTVALRPDGHTVLTGADSGDIRLVDLYHGALIRRIPLLDTQPLFSVFAFSSDGTTFVTDVVSDAGLDTFQLALFDAFTGAEIQRIGPDDSNPVSATFSPNGQQMVTAYTRQSTSWASVWNMTTGEELNHFESDIMIHSASFSPDGKFVLLGERSGSSGQIILWDLVSNQEATRLQGHTRAISAIVFPPENQTVLTASLDNLVILWDMTTGQEIRRYVHDAPVFSIDISPDGRTMITAEEGGVIRLWDLATVTELRRFFGQADASTYHIRFSPDGHTAFANYTFPASEVIQWDIETGSAINRFPVGSPSDIAFSLDGRSLFVPTHPDFSPAIQDYALYQFRIDTPAELLNWTQHNRYIRNFTCEERVLYRIETLCE